ncbi:hypothetical protein ACLOJK_018373 [Asimina triloba]
MNIIVAEEYNGFGGLASTLRIFVGQLKVKNSSFEEYVDCGLFVENRSAFCWGDVTGSGVLSLFPRIARSLYLTESNVDFSSSGSGEFVVLAPLDPMVSSVGGRSHACGIKSSDLGVVCWGFRLKNSSSTPNGVIFYQIAAGDYFTCGVRAEISLRANCWGSCFPSDSFSSHRGCLGEQQAAQDSISGVIKSKRRKSLVSEADVDVRITDGRHAGDVSAGGDGLRCLEEETGTASPLQDLSLQHNF